MTRFLEKVTRTLAPRGARSSAGSLLSFVSLRYARFSIATENDRAHVTAQQVRLEDGRLESEQLEGTLEGGEARRLLEGARQALTDRLGALLAPLRSLLGRAGDKEP